MSKVNYEKKFLDIYNSNIKREGADELLEVLKKSDFFVAPASTRYHEPYEGGLCEHSVKVYYELIKELQPNVLNDTYSAETIAIVALLHDICKTHYYVVDYRNAKNERGQWEKVPYYTVKDKLPYGHGEKSVLLITDGIELSLEESMAIRWHMGAYEGEHCWNTLGQAYNEFPLALYLHIADMKATYLKEGV